MKKYLIEKAVLIQKLKFFLPEISLLSACIVILYGVYLIKNSRRNIPIGSSHSNFVCDGPNKIFRDK